MSLRPARAEDAAAIAEIRLPGWRAALLADAGPCRRYVKAV
jgi:hypothetical protein